MVNNATTNSPRIRQEVNGLGNSGFPAMQVATFPIERSHMLSSSQGIESPPTPGLLTIQAKVGNPPLANSFWWNGAGGMRTIGLGGYQ